TPSSASSARAGTASAPGSPGSCGNPPSRSSAATKPPARAPRPTPQSGGSATATSAGAPRLRGPRAASGRPAAALLPAGRALVLPDPASLEAPVSLGVRLGDGYRVRARFVLREGDDVLLVPTSALFRAGDGWAVFVVGDGVARRRAVEVGHQDGLRAEVLGGLAPGERVLTHPSDAVTEGTRVAVE